MRRVAVSVAVAAFVLGIAAGLAIAAKKTFDTTVFIGKDKKEATAALLAVAKEQAGKGSWENLAVARIHYLAGDKAAAQAIIDAVFAGKVEEEDWMRLGKIYVDAGEYDKAFEAFGKALDLDPKDAENYAKVGAFYNLRGQREKAEELFARAFEIKPDELWVTVTVAASYAGVRPQD